MRRYFLAIRDFDGNLMDLINLGVLMDINLLVLSRNGGMG